MPWLQFLMICSTNPNINKRKEHGFHALFVWVEQMAI